MRTFRTVEMIHKCTLLGSARILRKVFEVKIERKANKGCVLAFLGNLSLSEANDETSVTSFAM